jgi:ribonuclease Z
MEARLTILGSNSALPAQGRHPSAQLLQFHHESCLIDCGEGTQLQMSNYGIRRSKITYIFISHLHGDHIYGLPGLITSYNHYTRKEPLTIYGPIGIKRFIENSVYITGNALNFELYIHEFDADTPHVLIDTKWVTIKTRPLRHRIPTSGFLFTIKYPLLKIKEGIFDAYQVPHEQRKLIQGGADFIKSDGEVISNLVFTEKPLEPLTYAYLSDTVYLPSLVPDIDGFHTIYHEATFLSELAEKAEQTKHSTAAQAAQIAKEANVKQLIIGHFSSRYDDLTPLLDEARAVFADTELAEEGREFKIG